MTNMEGKRKTPNQIEDAPLCRMCGVPLLTNAEAKIGTHIRCIFLQKKQAVTIPRPIYGRRPNG